MPDTIDIREARGFCLDMDGVIYRGDERIPGAAEFLDCLRRRGLPFVLITNHACKTPDAIAAKLDRLGIDVPAEQIYTAAQATADHLAAQGVRQVYTIGEGGLYAALADAGIEPRAAEPTHVVASLDRELRYDDLTQAYRHILAGAEFIGTNGDLSYPLADGPAPEAGWVLAALEALTGQSPRIIGKPSPVMYQLAARRTGIAVDQLAMIGDRLDTDIAGAVALDMPGILVLTGHASRADLAASPVQPTLVVEDLSDLRRELAWD